MIDAIPYNARAAPIGALAGVGLLAIASVVIAETSDSISVPVAMVVATVVAASAAGYAVEDAASATVASTPITLGRRRALRLADVPFFPVLCWAVAAMIVRQGGDTSPVTTHHGVIALAVAGLAVSAAAVTHALGYDHEGLTGSLGAVVVVLGITMFGAWYQWLPSVFDDARPQRWLAVAVVAWIAAVWLSRDPAGSARLAR